MQLPQLKRIRWAVRAALFLGVAASVAANVLHAQPNIISQTISAWPPLALLLTVELTSRIPMHRPLLAFLRVVSTIAIAGIAAWVSYWHMQDVAVRYGETEISAYLLPISVDGLIVVASVSLVELAGRIRTLEDQANRAANGARNAPAPATSGPASVPPVRFQEPAPTLTPTPAPVPVFQNAPAAAPAVAAADAPARGEGNQASQADESANAVATTVTEDKGEPAEDAHEQADAKPATGRTPNSPLSGRPLTAAAPVSPAVAAVTKPVPAYANGSTPPRTAVSAAVSAPARTVVTAAATRPAAESNAPRQRRPILETADLADEIEAMHPDITQTELARRLGISPTRLRAVRREARELRRAAAAAKQ
ncbi:MAG TPA: DUF2637 domain-containing protein [Micromonosporaceae bacterium]|nr:DUF2637 domain-containing protein [Micromonosporaceae bacterium]